MPTTPNSASYVTDFTRDSEIWFLPVWKDKDGTVIQNTAKGPYPKPLIAPMSVGVIRATVRKSTYTDTNYRDQLNATNSGDWRQWTAGQAWIGRILTKDVNEGGSSLVEVKYTVYCTKLGWKEIAPQLGYYYKDGSNAKVFVDADSLPYLGCLDNSGGKLAVSSDMILKEWSIKDPIDFSVLGF